MICSGKSERSREMISSYFRSSLVGLPLSSDRERRLELQDLERRRELREGLRDVLYCSLLRARLRSEEGDRERFLVR